MLSEVVELKIGWAIEPGTTGGTARFCAAQPLVTSYLNEDIVPVPGLSRLY